MVGRHSFDSWSDPSIPAVGDNLGIDYERLILARPDAVVMEANATALPGRLRGLAEDRGFRVERVAVLSLDDVRSAIGRMDRLTRGVGVDAPLSVEALEMRARFDEALSEDAAAARGLGRVLIVGSVSPLSVTGPGSFHHDLVERIGADALPDEGASWIRLSAEDAAALGPDTVVVLSPGDPGLDAASAMPAFSRLLPGVFGEAGGVVVVSGEESMLPGAGLMGVAEALKAAGRSRGSGGDGGDGG